MVTFPIVAPLRAKAGEGPAREASRSRAVPLVCGCFLVLGVATVMLGPALPLLAARWKIPDAQLGTLFLATFTGQFCGSWMATPRVRASLFVGAIVAALGMLMLTVAGPATAHLALFCAGLGVGAGLTAGNVIVGTGETGGTSGATSQAGATSQTGSGSSRSRELALLNVAWGVGAIACPVLLDASLHMHRFHAAAGNLFFAGLALALIGCAALIAALLPKHSPRFPAAEGTREDCAASVKIPSKVLFLFGATLMLYVGVENSLGGWLPTYASRLAPGIPVAGRASAIALSFWIFEFAGRGLTALAIERVNESRLYRVCIVALIAAAATLVLSPRPGTIAVFALVSVSALSLGPLYPLAISFLLARTGNHPRVGKIFAFSSLGGTVLPWLTGIVSTEFHTLRIGFAVPLAGAALLLALSLSLPRGEERALTAGR